MFKFISRQTELDEKVYSLEVLNELLDAEYIAFDFETTGLDIFTLSPILLGLETGSSYDIVNKKVIPGNSYVIDFLTYDIEEVYNALQPLLSKLWIGHNIVYDYQVFEYHFNIKLKNMHCTMLGSQILYNGSDDIKHSYAAVVNRHFDTVISKDDVQSFINRDLTLPITRAELEYLKNDLVWLKPLYDRQMNLGSPEKKNLWECFKLENNFIRVMSHMMLNGVAIDGNKWMQNTQNNQNKVEELYESLKEKTKKLCIEFEIYNLVKSKKKVVANQVGLFADKETVSVSKMIEVFNPRSSDQILRFLTRLGVKIESTGEEVLLQALYKIEDERIKDFINELIELRGYEKLVSTYGMTFINKNLHPKTMKIHTHYFQCNTDTHRLSSSKPNLQNIPATTEMRSPFVPDDVEKYDFVSLDMSGQELRLAASNSQDQLILKSFNEGLDLHSVLAQTTHRIIKKDPTFVVSKKVNEDLRTEHKPVLFGFIYGAGAKRISDILNIPMNVAQEVHRALSKVMPELSAYMNIIKKQAVADKFIVDGTKLNRRQSFTIWRTKPLLQHSIEKKAINFPIQSVGSSMIKEAGIKMLDKIEEEKLDCAIKLQCHDEYVIQIPKGDAKVAEEFRNIMEEVGSSYLKGVRMESSMSIAPYWQK